MFNSVQSFKRMLSEACVWDKEMSFNRWEFIKRNDTIDSNLYFIDRGCVRVYFMEDVHEHSLYFGYDGSLISALDSFFSGKSSSLAIQCINKTQVKVISKPTFDNFIQKTQGAFSLWQNVLVDLSIWHLEREKDLLVNSPKLRYERVLSRQPLLLQKVPHKYIASYLRLRPETFSKIQNS